MKINSWTHYRKRSNKKKTNIAVLDNVKVDSRSKSFLVTASTAEIVMEEFLPNFLCIIYSTTTYYDICHSWDIYNNMMGLGKKVMPLLKILVQSECKQGQMEFDLR